MTRSGPTYRFSKILRVRWVSPQDVKYRFPKKFICLLITVRCDRNVTTTGKRAMRFFLAFKCDSFILSLKSFLKRIRWGTNYKLGTVICTRFWSPARGTEHQMQRRGKLEKSTGHAWPLSSAPRLSAACVIDSKGY